MSDALRRARKVVLAGAVCAAAGFAFAAPADAGATRPPVTDGYVVYGTPTVTPTCTNGVPTALTLTEPYDASALHTGYDVSVQASVADSGGNTPAGDAGTKTFTPAPGTSGTWTYQLPLPTPPAAGDTVYATGLSTVNGYNYFTMHAALTCAAVTFAMPTVSFGRVSCAGAVPLTVDATAAAAGMKWDSIVFDAGAPTSGFWVSDPVASGHTGTTPLTGVAAGEVIQLQEQGVAADNSTEVAADYGWFTLKSGCAKATLASTTVFAGGADSVHGTGFDPGETVTATLHSTPVTLGSGTVDRSGTLTLPFTVPAGVAPGTHTVTLTGAGSGLTASATLIVPASRPMSSPAPTASLSTSVGAATTAPYTPPAGTAAAGSSAPLANTGFASSSWTLLGVALAAAGTALAFLGRRRQRPAHHR